MIDVRFLHINNERLVGMLLPFWARGKKMFLFLLSCLRPLVSLHSNFSSWALERYIESHITGQKYPLEWYLTYKLSSHFQDKNARFRITYGEGDAQNVMFFGIEYYKSNQYTAPIYYKSEDKAQDEMILYYRGEKEEKNGVMTVYAPAIVPVINYDQEDYEIDIHNILSMFLTTFKKYIITIQ